MRDDSIAWHDEVVPHAWKPALVTLRERSVLEPFYLAGGTGLALQIGHPVFAARSVSALSASSAALSVDLDLFNEQDFPAERLRDRLRGALAVVEKIYVGPRTKHRDTGFGPA